jgi:phage tail protein X
MAAGLCAAWPFRKTLLDEDEFQVSPAPAAVTSRLPRPALSTTLSHEPADEPAPAPRHSEPEIGHEPLTAVLDRGVPRRELVKLDQTAALPRLPARYSSQSSDVSFESRSAVPEESGSSSSPAGTPSPPRDRRYYRIRRHDTLEDIAERLLGSRAHADKLLAANADVILVREILPVGVTIVVPELHEPPTTIVRLPESGN